MIKENSKVRFYEILAQEAMNTKKGFFNPNLKNAEQFVFARYWAINCDVLEDITKAINKSKYLEEQDALLNILENLPKPSMRVEEKSLGFLEYTLWKLDRVSKKEPNNQFLKKELKCKESIFLRSGTALQRSRFLTIKSACGL